jgi:transposase-like protein
LSNYNWAKIKAEYETGKYSMREISKKHGCNEKYALRKAKKDGWNKGESRKEVENMASKKVLLMIESKMQGEWGNKKKPNFEILKSTKISTEILQNVMNMKYELLDIQKVAKKIQNEIDIKDVPSINIVRGGDGGK